MSQPFAKFDVLWTSAKSQKVAFDVKRGILLLKEVLDRIVVIRNAVYAEGGGNRGRIHETGRMRGIPCWRLILSTVIQPRRVIIVIVVVFVGPPAKSLAAIVAQ